MAEIVIRNLRKEFGAFTAVQSSSFTVGDGEFFMLLGPSGCGKTTTLRMIAGLELPTSGQILIDGQDVSQKPASQRDIAFVFQMFALYPHMNVRKNISYPLISQGMPKEKIRTKVAEVARILGIESILDRPVGGLSGGDRQRVALARAIVREPAAFMMDEPLGALDAEFREHMAEELRALHDRMGATTVYVTHDQLEAMQMGDKIVVMNHGVVEQFGTPADLVANPASAFVATFVGTPPNNLVPVIKNGTGFKVGGRHMAISSPQDEALAMFRAESLGLAEAEGPRTLPLELAEVSTIAGRTMVTGIAHDIRLTAITERPPAAQIGEAVHIALPDSADAWFAPSGERIG